jgi:two-component system, OmpR family, response regulator
MTAILVIDDEPAVCSVIRLLLGREGLTVVTCADGQAALEVLPSQDFAAALIDLGLERVQGLHIIEAVRAAKPALPIVVMSGALAREGDDHLPGLSAEIEGLHRLPKPFKPHGLMGLMAAITRPKSDQAAIPRVAEAVADGG